MYAALCRDAATAGAPNSIRREPLLRLPPNKPNWSSALRRGGIRFALFGAFAVWRKQKGAAREGRAHVVFRLAGAGSNAD
jgi:hypothetical protein